MHQCYDDILNAIPGDPLWWQAGGVPRYAPFSPEVIPDIYADETALVEIACQSCDTRFHVCFTSSKMHRIMKALQIKGDPQDAGELSDRLTLANAITEQTIHYGDPPNIGCCPAGPTMNSVPIRVIEYWSRHHADHVANGIVTDIASYMEWSRDGTLETSLQDDGVSEG